MHFKNSRLQKLSSANSRKRANKSSTSANNKRWESISPEETQMQTFNSTFLMSRFSFKVQACPWEREHRRVNPRYAGNKTAPRRCETGKEGKWGRECTKLHGPVCEPTIVSSRPGFRGCIVLCCLHWDSWNHWITNLLLGRLTIYVVSFFLVSLRFQSGGERAPDFICEIKEEKEIMI